MLEVESENGSAETYEDAEQAIEDFANGREVIDSDISPEWGEYVWYCVVALENSFER